MTTTATVLKRDQVAQALGLGNMIDAIDEVIDNGGTASTKSTAKLSKPAKIISMVSVTVAGASTSAALGPRIIGDNASTASATVVKVGTDDQTLTFENHVGKVRVKYLPIPVSE